MENCNIKKPNILIQLELNLLNKWWINSDILKSKYHSLNVPLIQRKASILFEREIGW